MTFSRFALKPFVEYGDVTPIHRFDTDSPVCRLSLVQRRSVLAGCVHDGEDMNFPARDKVEHAIRKAREIQPAHILESHTIFQWLAAQLPDDFLRRVDEAF
jgi:hypothetical protein